MILIRLPNLLRFTKLLIFTCRMHLLGTQVQQRQGFLYDLPCGNENISKGFSEDEL